MVREILFNQPRSLLRPGFIFYDMDTTSKGILPKTTITREALEELIKHWQNVADYYDYISRDGDCAKPDIYNAHRTQLLSCISDLKTLLATT